MSSPHAAQENLPHIVILGAGFGGLFAAKALAKTKARITLVDRHNYHLFQPLLYQVATAGLPPSDIAWPIRSILNRQCNVQVLLDEVKAIHTESNEVELSGTSLKFDYLIAATGAKHAYFGHDEWESNAPGLKSIDDATSIRRRLLTAFEQAEMTEDPQERARLMEFVIVGGGPTGVEMAGAIAELAHHTLAADFRRIDPRSARITLVEAGSRILPAFHESLSNYAKRSLEKLGVEVRVNAMVTECNSCGVLLGDENLPAANVIWAAGVAASPIGEWLNAQTDRSGRVIVEPDLSVAGQPNIFVIGDAASVKDANGNPVPGIAPAAKQQGRYVAKIITARIKGGSHPHAFRYRHAGNLATIGRKSAIIEFPFMRLKGFLAWWIWGVAHIYFLIGVPSPLIISFRWFWQYLTYGRGARLITGSEDAD
ncbi:MAG: NAD(P)/FAD-dependent oxidoreductase [Gammaproteobacteria bacterium]|nr:NAD(P)/FAD-dependent oxidoreductase [Gammaproteobacteria bacterium]